MIFEALKKTGKDFVSKPQVLLPMLVIALAGILLENLTSWTIEGILADIILYSESLAEIDFFGYIISHYPLEIITMLVTGFVILVITLIAAVSIARMANGKGFVEAVNSSVLEWKRTIGLAVFSLIVLGLLGFFWYIILGFFALIDTLTGGVLGGIIYFLIIPLILIILVAILMTKLVFVLPAFADGEKVRDAIQKSWDFSNKSMLKSFVFIIIVLAITYVVSILLTFYQFQY